MSWRIFSNSIRLPSKKYEISPESLRINARINRKSVVLPAPAGPIIPCRMFGEKLSETRFNALLLSNVLHRFLTKINGELKELGELFKTRLQNHPSFQQSIFIIESHLYAID